MIGQSEKILKVERLFKEIKSLFPDNSVALTMHDIDMNNLPEHWDVEDHIATDKSVFTIARRNRSTFDITLFSNG